jgi:hypothetical protein
MQPVRPLVITSKTRADVILSLTAASVCGTGPHIAGLLLTDSTAAIGWDTLARYPCTFFFCDYHTLHLAHPPLLCTRLAIARGRWQAGDARGRAAASASGSHTFLAVHHNLVGDRRLPPAGGRLEGLCHCRAPVTAMQSPSRWPSNWWPVGGPSPVASRGDCGLQGVWRSLLPAQRGGPRIHRLPPAASS